MNLSTLKDNLMALRSKLEKMFEEGEHGVPQKVGEMVGEVHTLLNDTHGILVDVEARVAKLEKALPAAGDAKAAVAGFAAAAEGAAGSLVAGATGADAAGGKSEPAKS